MEEIYRDIPGYEGMYQCSNLGNVKTLRREYISGNGVHKWTEEKLLKQQTKNGYKRVVLCKNGKGKYYFVHRLVAITFPEICGVFEDGLEINHKDCNPSNNEASNIEVCTHQYNLHYGDGINKRKKSFKETFDKKGRQTEEERKRKKHEYNIKYYKEYRKNKKAG